MAPLPPICPKPIVSCESVLSRWVTIPNLVAYNNLYLFPLDSTGFSFGLQSAELGLFLCGLGFSEFRSQLIWGGSARMTRAPLRVVSHLPWASQDCPQIVSSSETKSRSFMALELNMVPSTTLSFLVKAKCKAIQSPSIVEWIKPCPSQIHVHLELQNVTLRGIGVSTGVMKLIKFLQIRSSWI